MVKDARFCDECGATTPEPAASTATPGIRKVVSILFADLSGSTGLQEQLDPEATRRVMDEVHALLRHAVESHGGRVVKFTGDGAMAVFGIPVLREDDAVRAVRAGATMQADFAAMADVVHRDQGVAIGLRVGVNTGEVVVALGSDDVVGDPVNVASRLEASAGVGEVLMGELTHRLVRDVLKVETVEPLRLRGKSELVGAARLVSVGGIGAASVTPLVGRDADLATLTAAFEEAVSVSECRLVSVIGAPGLGKSRLAAELATGLGDRARVVVVRFIPDGGSSFGPLIEALRPFVEDPAFLAGLDADGQAVGETLGALLAGGVSGSTEQVFWAYRRLLQGLAVNQPVLLVLDDLHWAEPTMLDLIEHLIAWLREGPVLLLALARPELSDLRPEMVEADGPATAIVVLGALDDNACRRLASDILEADEVPESVLARALEASEGNPLFLRELLRLLVDDGVLSRVGGGWTATVDVDAVELPATLHAALAARIEQLEPDTREVLQAASVIGRHFARGAVAALLPRAVAARLDEHLGILHRRGLVDPEGTWWVDERLYQFHHALIRDAAYRRILKRVRAELHERYADWLAARVGDAATEHDEVLGWHLEQAHVYLLDLGEATDPTLIGRAVGHLAAAGRRALERDDVGSAATLLGRALRLAPGDADLMRDRCEALICHGDTAAASEVVAALAAAASEERSVAMAEVFDAQLAGLRDPGALQETARRSAAAARVFVRCGDEVGAAKAESVQAVALAGLGQMAACEAALDRSLAAARRAGNQRLANVVLSIAPLAALWGPSPVARASGRCLDVVRVLQITSWAPQVEAQALRCQAVLEAMRDRPEAARRMLEDARALFTTLGSRLGLLETALHAGQVELLAGAPAVAEGHLLDAIGGFTTLGVRVAAARATALLARALLDLGRFEEAEAIAEPSQGGDDLKAAIGLLGVRAEALARRGDIAEAEVLARRAVELAEPTDALVDHADARVGLARVLAAAGRTTESAAELSRAQRLYEAKGSLVGARQTGLTPLAQLQIPVVPAPEVRPNAASELFELYHRRLNSGLLPDETICAPAFLVEDHVTHLIEDLASIQATRADVVDGTTGWRFGGEVVATLGERCVVYLERFSSDADRRGASSTEDSRLLVLALGDTGRFDRCHVFDPADHEPAMAVLRHLHAVMEGPRRVVRHNRATMCLARWAAAMRTGDTNAVLAAHAPGYINVHHRMQDTLTLDQQRDTELDVAGHAMVEVQALASLGERHALHRMHMGWAYDSLGNVVGPADGEAGEVAYDLLLVSQTDHTGANVRTDMFEAEHLAEALACLLEHWAEDELTGTARRRALQSAAGSFAEAINRRDWDAYRAQFADDVVLIDHTPVSAGEIRGSAAVRDWTRQFTEAAEGTQVLLVDVLAFTPDAALVRSVVSGSLQGGPFDLAWDIAARFGPDGRFDRLEFFYEDESAAWDAFEEMDGHNGSNSGHEQGACRWMRCWSEAILDRDLDALAALYGSEAVVEDHRPLMQEVFRGPAENLSNVAAVLDLGAGGVGFESEVLAVLEDRLGLFRNRFVLEAGEVDILFVAQIEDGTGLLERAAVYGPGDTEAAYRALAEYKAALIPVGDELA